MTIHTWTTSHPTPAELRRAALASRLPLDSLDIVPARLHSSHCPAWLLSASCWSAEAAGRGDVLSGCNYVGWRGLALGVPRVV